MINGGHRKGAGRKAGVPNRSTQEIKAIIHRVVNFEQLCESLAEASMSGNILAARLLLEYGFGKAPQPITGEGGGPVAVQIVQDIPLD